MTTTSPAVVAMSTAPGSSAWPRIGPIGAPYGVRLIA